MSHAYSINIPYFSPLGKRKSKTRPEGRAELNQFLVSVRSSSAKQLIKPHRDNREPFGYFGTAYPYFLQKYRASIRGVCVRQTGTFYSDNKLCVANDDRCVPIR